MPRVKNRSPLKPVWPGPGPQPPIRKGLERLIDRYKQFRAGKTPKDLHLDRIRERLEAKSKKEKGGGNG